MADFVYVNSNPSQLIPGAITGENPSPSCAMLFSDNHPNSGYLTTGTLSSGDTGEMGGQTQFTVEFFTGVGGTTISTRNLVLGPEISAGNRQWGFQITGTKTISFYVRNTTPTLFTVTSTTKLLDTGNFPNNTWYHIVGGISDAGNVVLYINGNLEASTAFSGTVAATSGSGTAADLRVNDAANDIALFYDELAIYRRWIGADRVAAHYDASANKGFASKKSDARMIDVLDDSTSHTAPRYLRAGARNVVESYEYGQAPLDELQRARAADNGDAMLFVSKSGTITFLDAGHRIASPWNTVQAVFGDGGGSELPYEDFNLDYSDAFLVNQWNVTRTAGRSSSGDNGSTQTASDATSISAYFKRSQSLTDVPVTTDSDASTIASLMLAKYKNPMLRGISITVNTADAQTALTCLQREIGDRVEVKRRPPGGGTVIDQQFFIRRIALEAGPNGPWKITFGLSLI